MKALNTLIKLKKKELDELRSRMAELIAHQETLQKAKDLVEYDLARESDFITNNPELNFAFSPFYSKCKFAITSLQIKIESFEKQILQAQDEMIDLFSELKRFEIVRENRIKEEKEQEKLRETKIFDEIGLNSFNRNQESL